MESTIPTDVECVKSLGAYFDMHLKCDKQVTFMYKTALYHLFQISKIKQFLTLKQLKSVIHTYVTSSIDHNNSLLLGLLPEESIKNLQSVQNAALKLTLGLKKYDHVMPALITLHWLPVEYCILFRVLILTFRSLNGQ